MPYRSQIVRRARVCTALIVSAALAACGGGGGGGTSGSPATSPPTVTSPAAGTIVLPGKQSSGGGGGGFVNDGKNPSVYTVTSNPSGQAFTLAGQSYTTPAQVTPSASVNALSIAFDTGYTVPIVQVYDGPHTVFYNKAGDSTGTVNTTTLQSLRRTTASVKTRLRLAAVHRPLRHIAHAVAGTIDPTRVAVRLSASRLGASGRSPADVERAAGAVAGRDTPSATADRLRIVTVPAGTSVAAFTRALQAQSEVAEVSPVHVRHALARQSTTVSDPGFNIPDQWYTFATGANYAWSYNPGTGTKIAVIDTGVDEANTDLTSQIAFQETAITPIDNAAPPDPNGPAPSCDPLTGATTTVTPNTARDDDGHGTNVMGIAIAKQNSAGFVGAGWGAQLMAFKVFPDQNQYCNNASTNFGANASDEARAIADAVAQGADVISLSLGDSAFDTTEFNAIESAIAAGVTVVAAAGNGEDGSGTGTLDYPAAYPGVISVGATALKDEYYTDQQPQNSGTYTSATEIVATYSQFGPSLSVVAPGGDPSGCVGSAGAGQVCDQDLLHWIAGYTTSTAYQPNEQCSTPSPATNCTALFAGTSMATPQVAATAAMLIAEAGGHRKLTPAQVNYIIESTADNINDAKQGHGRLNAYKALASLIRDTGAYTGPSTQAAGTNQLLAFAYAKARTNVPAIVDANFPAGVPVGADGTFRIADVPTATGTYGVAVWYDANGDGVVDPGDQIGTATNRCSSATACAIGSVTMSTVPAGYYLP